MACVPVEVAVTDDAFAADVSSAIALANAAQSEFVFGVADDDLRARLSMHAYEHAQADDLLGQMEAIRTEVRGYHPFVIGVVPSRLDGKRYTNLFGSHRAESGIAIISTALVAGVVVPEDRMVAYFIYYLARYALSFLAPDHRNHEDSRGCVFDRKVLKADIAGSMRAAAFCDVCRRDLVRGGGVLSPRQFSALNMLFAISGHILAEGVERRGRARVFVGSSSEGLGIANKLQELLSDDFSVVVWNRGTIFGLGQSTLEALESAVLEYHNGIFVFTPDDELVMRGEPKHVARDNVIFELGMFVGKLGRRNAFVLHPGRHAVALPSDLSGITAAVYDPDERNLTAALGGPINRIRTAIREGRPQRPVS